MMKMTFGKCTSFILVCLLVFALFSIVPISSRNASAAGTFTVGPTGQYQTIQAAIDNSQPGDTIRVSAGTYFGQITINKNITLVGESSSNTVIHGQGAGSVIWITSDDVNITGFNITGSGGYLYDAGITLIGVSGCNITNTTITGNHFGIFMTASHGNTVHSNNFMNNTLHAFDDGTNAWNIALPTGGNYWDDQELADEDDNGVMDGAYIIPGGANRDLRPWAARSGWESYEHEIEVNAVTIMLIGMGVVFSILTILWVSTQLTGVIIHKFESGKLKPGQGETETIAAIAAAIDSRRD